MGSLQGRNHGKTPPQPQGDKPVLLGRWSRTPLPSTTDLPPPISVGRAATFLDTHSWFQPLPATTLTPPSLGTAAQAATSCNSSHREEGPRHN